MKDGVKPSLSEVISTDKLRIERQDGGREKLVIAFTGIGHNLGGFQQAEFVASSAQGGANTSLFVIDPKRSWYSTEGTLELMAEKITEVWEELGRPQIVTLGNSMGGYAAILAARVLPVTTVLSFAPQFTMNRAVIEDPRWSHYRDTFGPMPVKALDEVIDGGAMIDTHYYVIHGAQGLDHEHYLRFPVSRQVSHYVLPRAGHGVISTLKGEGVMYGLIAAAMERDDAAFDRLARQVGAFRKTRTHVVTARVKERIGLLLHPKQARRRRLMLARSRADARAPRVREEATGRCSCRAVTYRALQVPNSISAEHSRTARRASGGPFFAVDAIDLECDGDVVAYQQFDGCLHGFCPACGTTLFRRHTETSPYRVNVFTLDDKAGLRFTKEHNITERPRFYRFAGERQRMSAAEIREIYGEGPSEHPPVQRAKEPGQ